MQPTQNILSVSYIFTAKSLGISYVALVEVIYREGIIVCYINKGV